MTLRKKFTKTKDHIIYLTVYTIAFGLIINSFIACDKLTNENGTVTIFFKYNGKATEQGLVYIKPISSHSYEKNMELDVYGEAVFSNVKPGKYNILVEKYDYITKTSVQCDTTIEVTARYRMNEYKINLAIND